MNKPIPAELISEIERRDEEGEARVVAYAKSLGTSDSLQVRNKRLRKLVGSIPKEDLEQIKSKLKAKGRKILENDI